MSDIIEYVVRVSPDGIKRWFLNGKLHRVDGPAIEWPDGSKYWYLNGKEYSESEWKKEVNKKQTCDGKLIEIDGKRYKLVEI